MDIKLVEYNPQLVSRKQTAWSLQLSLWGTAIQEWFSSLPEIISQKLTEWWNAISTWFESTKESWKTKLDEWNTTIGEWFENFRVISITGFKCQPNIRTME